MFLEPLGSPYSSSPSGENSHLWPTGYCLWGSNASVTPVLWVPFYRFSVVTLGLPSAWRIEATCGALYSMLVYQCRSGCGACIPPNLRSVLPASRTYVGCAGTCQAHAVQSDLKADYREHLGLSNYQSRGAEWPKQYISETLQRTDFVVC